MTRRSSALIAAVEVGWLDAAVLALDSAGAETVGDVLLAWLRDRAPGWPGSAEVGDAIAMRSDVVVMRALEAPPPR